MLLQCQPPPALCIPHASAPTLPCPVAGEGHHSAGAAGSDGPQLPGHHQVSAELPCVFVASVSTKSVCSAGMWVGMWVGGWRSFALSLNCPKARTFPQVPPPLTHDTLQDPHAAPGLPLFSAQLPRAP